MARLQEQLKAVILSLSEDRESRKEADKNIVAIAATVTNLDHRLAAVERQLLHNTPTIEEFTRIKNQVQGAGIFGKWIWFLGGLLISGIYNGREAVKSLFLQ